MSFTRVILTSQLPGVFTSLVRNLGVRGLEVIELYDVEPWAVDHLNPKGLIFCFFWRNVKDTHSPVNFADPAAGRIWFANQLIDDACASQAILNIVLNCPDINIGDELRRFRQETEHMSVAVGCLSLNWIDRCYVERRIDERIGHLQFSLSARSSQCSSSVCSALAGLSTIDRCLPTSPADLRGASYGVTRATLETQSSKSGTRRPGKNSPQWQRMKGEKKSRAAIVSDATGEEEESYHFIGYVPAYGKVWELDGLKPGPLEVGELPEYQASHQTGGASSTKGWMDVVRPALRMKMKKYGGSSKGDNIRFSLLALVDDQFQMASDDLEILKRERRALERRLDDVHQHDWRSKVR